MRFRLFLVTATLLFWTSTPLWANSVAVYDFSAWNKQVYGTYYPACDPAYPGNGYGINPACPLPFSAFPQTVTGQFGISGVSSVFDLVQGQTYQAWYSLKYFSTSQQPFAEVNYSGSVIAFLVNFHNPAQFYDFGLKWDDGFTFYNNDAAEAVLGYQYQPSNYGTLRWYAFDIKTLSPATQTQNVPEPSAFLLLFESLGGIAMAFVSLRR